MPFIKIDPAGSYLADPSSGDDAPPTQVSLAEIGVQAGQILRFEVVGDFSYWQEGNEEEDDIAAVFVDSNGNYVSPDVFPSVYTEDLWTGSPSDIYEDFELSNGNGDFTHIRVPNGATSILFSVQDSYFSDNRDFDNDFGVSVVVTDGMLNGIEAIRWFIDFAEQGLEDEDEDEGVPFFFTDLVDWSTFLDESWNSILYLTSDNESLNWTSSSGGTLQVQSSLIDGYASSRDQIRISILDSDGNRFDWSVSYQNSWTSDLENGSGSVSLEYKKVGSPSTRLDDISISYSADISSEEEWGEGFSRGASTSNESWNIVKGDGNSGFQYSLSDANFNDEWFWSQRTESESWSGTLEDLRLEDYDIDLEVGFSVDVSSTSGGNGQLFQFRDLEASYQGKTYEKDFFQFTAGENEFDVELTNYDEAIRFFQTEFIDRIKAFEVSNSGGSSGSNSSSAGSGSGSTGNVTNVTNITNNVTNNITNNTNINSGNTTNVNSGNTTTTNNNVAVNVLKNITTYDASITNDASVRTTVVGNVTKHEGSTTNNIIVGSDGVDELFGYAGSDRFLSSKGDDVFDGGEGIDGVTFNGNRSDFVLRKSGDNWVIEDTRATDANEGTDTLVGVERLGFGDQAIALDTEGPTSAGGIYRLYKATFNREPDTGGLGYWIGEADLETKDAVRMAEDFTWSQEFQNLYNITTTDNYGTGNNIRALIEGFYENVLGRTPDEGGLNFYTGVIESKDRTVGRVLAEISDSQENYDGTIELIANGIVFEPYVG